MNIENNIGLEIEFDKKYARCWKDDKGVRYFQFLTNHLQAVAELASKFAKSFGAEKIAFLTGKAHDVAKEPVEFQEYLLDDHAKRGSIPHSMISAKYVYDLFAKTNLVLAELIANVVAAHHGHLYDFITPDGKAELVNKIMAQPLSKGITASFDEGSADLMFSELKKMLSLVPSIEEPTFFLSLFLLMIFSSLIDADRLDAYLAESQMTYEEFQLNDAQKPDWPRLLKALEEHISVYKIKTEMDFVRQDLSNQCGESGLRKRGIYKLEAPTGGGKTLSSLRFALVHADKHGLDRIIYVIPYLSILSQTADAVRKALGVDDKVVMEHHSNMLPEDTEYYKLHTGRWDRPIILTTQVQFLQSFFSAHGSDLRKLHAMANSVLIFDEVQSLPVNCVHLFNSAMNFLSSICGCTILLCTATQPLLDRVRRPILLSDNPAIANCKGVIKRTEIVDAQLSAGYRYSDLAEFVKTKHLISTLVIVNTKAAAKALFNELRCLGLPVLHLSTNMCPKHRDDVFTDLREKLRAKLPIVCISTQLIEAGVDISFECVVRDIAGLDSIWQAAGRCNRHGEFGEVKPVYVINIANENLSKLEDIKKGSEITARLFREGKHEDIDEYYTRYFFGQERRMDFPISGGGKIYDLLSVNQQGCGAFKNQGNPQKVELRAAIRSAAEAFYVIAPGQHEIIVPYGDSQEILKSLRKTEDIVIKSKLLRQLGQYSVSMYSYQYELLKEKGALSNHDGVCVLNMGFYDEQRGVDINDGKHEFLNA